MSHVRLICAVSFLLFAGPTTAQDPSKLPDEFKAFLKEVERTYRGTDEVDKSVIEELRKQYSDPKPDREAAILKVVRRAYATTPVIEQRIVREMQAAYKIQTPDQEERVLEAVRRGGALPPGTLSPDVVAERAAKWFRKFDRNKDGKLSADEMSDALRDQLATWDKDHDGQIDESEYTAYFAAGLKEVAAGVASGAIPIKLPKNAPPTPPVATPITPKPKAAVSVPDWFARLDEDGDGQVGLYEWKKAGRFVAEFLAIDRNQDGFIEAKELLAYMADHPDWKPGR